MSTASTATLEPKTELEGSGPRKASGVNFKQPLHFLQATTSSNKAVGDGRSDWHRC